jgi:hypothetical protein
MQLAEGLGPVHDVSEGRSGFHRYGMLVLLHGLLLSLAVSEVGIHASRVSQVKGKITKLVSWILNADIAQLTSATVVTDRGGCQGSPPALPREVR